MATMMIVFVPMATYADNATHLTTSVPHATYTLNIPADQEIEFGVTATKIGDLTVSDATGFADGKNLEVTVTYTPFESETVDTTIPYTVRAKSDDDDKFYDINSGDIVRFYGKVSNTSTLYEKPHLSTSTEVGVRDITEWRVSVDSDDWGRALGGDYSSEIVFTAEVVVD